MLLSSRELGLRDVFNDKAGVARTTDFWPATNTGRRVRAQTKETTQPKVHLDTSEDHHGGEQLNYQLKLKANCHSLLKATPTKSVTLSNLESKETFKDPLTHSPPETLFYFIQLDLHN